LYARSVVVTGVARMRRMAWIGMGATGAIDGSTTIV